MASIYEEDITGLPSSIDYPVLNLQPQSRASQFSILNQAAPTQPTPVGGTVQGTEGPIPTLPGQQGGLSRFVQTGLIPALQQLATGFIRNPQVQQDTLNRIAQQQEQQRKQRAGQEAQSVTGILSAALASGNPTKFAEAVKQISGLKNIEPETGQAVQDLMLKMSAKMGEDAREKQEEAALGEILKNLPQAEAKPIGDFIAAGGKPADALKLYSTGLLRSKTSIAAQMKELQDALGSQPGGAGGMQPTYNISSKGELSVSLGPPTSQIQKARQELSAFMPPNHPRFDEMVGKYMSAQAYVGEMTQNVALRRVHEEVAGIMREGQKPSKDALARAGVTQEQYDRAFQIPPKAGAEKPKQPSTKAQAEQLANSDIAEMILNVAPSNQTATNLFDEVAKEKARLVEVETQAREKAKRDYGDLPAKLRDDLQAISEDVSLAQYVNKSFTDADLKKYVGLMNQPYNQLKSFFVSQFGLGSQKGEQEMAKFSRFHTLTRKLFSGVFAIGGKQLTPYEGAVVEDIRVTGKEQGGWIQYKAKLESMIAFGEASVKNKLDFYRTAPKNLDPIELTQQMEKYMEEKLSKQGWIPGKSFQEVYDSKSKTFKYVYPGAK